MTISAEASEVTGGGWPEALVDLYLRPQRFFLGFGRHCRVVFVVWICGIAGAIDRIEGATLANQMRGTAMSSAFLSDWSAYWTTVLFMGLPASAFLWWVGGWWYGVRLRLSGASNVPADTARRLNLFSSLVPAPAVIAWAMVATARHSNHAAANADDQIQASALALLIWSLFVSFRGANACFSLRYRAAIWWFVILPGALYATIVMGVLVAVLWPTLQGWTR